MIFFFRDGNFSSLWKRRGIFYRSWGILISFGIILLGFGMRYGFFLFCYIDGRVWFYLCLLFGYRELGIREMLSKQLFNLLVNDIGLRNVGELRFFQVFQEVRGVDFFLSFLRVIYLLDRMFFAILYIRIKSSMKVRIQRRLCSGKWSYVLWWMCILEF